MNALVNYEWPGNIRELEHYMERSLLLANSTRIDQIHYPITQTPEDKKTGNRPKTISEIEREHILNILRKCGGKVFGKRRSRRNAGYTSINIKFKNQKIRYCQK